MFKMITAPDRGHRTYRLMLMSLIVATLIGVLCILKGVDLVSASALITSITAPVCGFGALNNRNNPTPVTNGNELKGDK